MSKEKPTGRCIVTYGRSLIALEIAHSLAERGVEVIGCDDVDLTVMSFSRDVKKNFVHAPSDSKPEKFLDDLEKYIRKYTPEDDIPYVLIPAFRDIQLIAENRDRFDPLIKVAGPTAEMISRIHPKQNLARTAEKLDAHAPLRFSTGTKRLQPRKIRGRRQHIPSPRFARCSRPSCSPLWSSRRPRRSGGS